MFSENKPLGTKCSANLTSGEGSREEFYVTVRVLQIPCPDLIKIIATIFRAFTTSKEVNISHLV